MGRSPRLIISRIDALRHDRVAQYQHQNESATRGPCEGGVMSDGQQNARHYDNGQ
jgi:hypothetical protein